VDPVIFSFKLFNWEIVLRWYGVLVMLGALAGAFWAERELRHRGEDSEIVWDAMVWVLPIGIIGARLWYVMNNILGGSTYYTDDPARILRITEGGLHFFGGLLFGVITLGIYLKNAGRDFWLFLDALAPATLLGQAVARPANFINQELYGQPTQLPWGIPIEAGHRLAQFPVSEFPVETTRFHPTFAYEMILNFLIVLFLWWLSRRYKDEIKPGTLFGGWLLLAGLSRSFIEFFRPDQPRIGDSFVSYTMLVAFLMAVTGAIMLLVRYGKIKLAMAEGWEEEYHITKKVEEKPRRATTRQASVDNSVKSTAKTASKSTAKRSASTTKPKTKKAPAKKPASTSSTTKKATTRKTSTTKTTATKASVTKKSATKKPAAKKTTTKSKSSKK